MAWVSVFPAQYIFSYTEMFKKDKNSLLVSLLVGEILPILTTLLWTLAQDTNFTR